MKGVNFAAQKHTEQRRKDTKKSPYINHPISVSNRLSQAGVTDVNVLVAALLHDTIEDTGTSLEEIKSEFGNTVAQIVEECTDDKSKDKITRKKTQITHAKDISSDAKLVKMADKLDNLSGLTSDPPAQWSKEEIYGCALWSYCVCRKLYTSGDQESPARRLQKQLDTLFEHWKFPQLPESELQAQLESYYGCIHNSD